MHGHCQEETGTKHSGCNNLRIEFHAVCVSMCLFVKVKKTLKKQQLTIVFGIVCAIT